MSAPVVYWVRAARENSRWFVNLRREYRGETHAHKRAKLWAEARRCRERIAPLMSEARRVRADLARCKGAPA